MGTLKVIYSDPIGWLTSLFAFLATFVGSGADCFTYLFIVASIDLVFGIFRSWKQKVGPKSSGILSFGKKILSYGMLLLVFVCLDKALNSESYIASRGITAILIGGEIWSILGNMSVIYPNLASINLVKKLLASEIADKANLEKEDVEQILNRKDDTKATS